MKKVRRNSLIVLALTILLLFFLLRKDLPITLKAILSANKWLLIVAVFIFGISYIFDAFSYYFIVKQYKKDYSLKSAFRLNILTKFFNGITPLSSGGQPFQLYELHKDKIKMTEGSIIIIHIFMVYQVAFVIVNTLSLILLKLNNIMVIDKLAKNMFIIGYVINLAILLVLIFVSFNNKFNKKVINGIISFLTKLHIVKKPEEVKEKWNKNCEDFHSSAQIIIKNKKLLCLEICLQVLEIIFTYAVAFALIYAIGAKTSLNIIYIIALSSCVFMAGSYVPIPGATGGMEYNFYKFFDPFVKNGSIKALLILWRLVTYILPVLIGGLVFNIRKKDN